MVLLKVWRVVSGDEHLKKFTIGFYSQDERLFSCIHRDSCSQQDLNVEVAPAPNLLLCVLVPRHEAAANHNQSPEQHRARRRVSENLRLPPRKVTVAMTMSCSTALLWFADTHDTRPFRPYTCCLSAGRGASQVYAQFGGTFSNFTVLPPWHFSEYVKLQLEEHARFDAWLL